MFIYEKNIIPSLYRRYTEAGENLANREDLRLALVNDKPMLLNFIKEN